MEDILAQADRVTSILDQANVVDIKTRELFIHDDEQELSFHHFDFGTPEDISFMLEYLGIPDEEILSEHNLEITKTIHSVAKNSGKPLHIFLLEMGAKIGGKFIDRFADRVYAYLKLTETEHQIEEHLDAARGEKKTYEKQQ